MVTFRCGILGDKKKDIMIAISKDNSDEDWEDQSRIGSLPQSRGVQLGQRGDHNDNDEGNDLYGQERGAERR